MTMKPVFISIVCFIFIWAANEIVQDYVDNLIPPYPPKERTLPTFDTEPINQLKAAYYMGGSRVIDGCTLDSCWKMDSVIFQKYFIKKSQNRTL